MIDVLPEYFSDHISIIDGCNTNVLPSWAATLMWLGAWCRKRQIDGSRLIVFAILPTRNLAAAFAGVGCVISGSSIFEEKLSWPRFRGLPIGSMVFYKAKNGKSYGATIVEFENISGNEFIKIMITKASRKADIGVVVSINESQFDDYNFTENKPPTAANIESLGTLGSALDSLTGKSNEKWLWSDAPEGLIITNVTSFESSNDDLSISIRNSKLIYLNDFLCLSRNNNNSHSKLRLDHPKGTLDGDFPLAILDGAKSFFVYEHIPSSRNILVILDRSEYTAEINEVALNIKSYSKNISNDLAVDIPTLITAGIEISAYLIEDL